jgi:hypothetical protein
MLHLFATALFLLREWDGDLAWAETAIAVAEAEQNMAPVGVTLLLAGDWELVVLKEHVVEMDHLSNHHSLVLRSPLSPTLSELKEVGIRRSAARDAPVATCLWLLLGDGTDVVLARLSGDVELRVAAEVLATTEAHRSLSDTDHRLVGVGSWIAGRLARGIALPELDGRSATTTTDWDEATGDEGIGADLTSHLTPTTSGKADIATMETHLILAALAADEAVGHALATAKALHGHESAIVPVRLGEVGTVATAWATRATAEEITRVLWVGGDEELGDDWMPWLAADTAAAILGAAFPHLFLNEEHWPWLWLTPRLHGLTTVFGAHRLVHATEVGKHVGVWHGTTSDSLEHSVLLDHLDARNRRETGSGLGHLLSSDTRQRVVIAVPAHGLARRIDHRETLAHGHGLWLLRQLVV